MQLPHCQDQKVLEAGVGLPQALPGAGPSQLEEHQVWSPRPTKGHLHLHSLRKGCRRPTLAGATRLSVGPGPQEPLRVGCSSPRTWLLT